MDPRAAALSAYARQKTKQAQDACRKATRALAAAEDADVYTVRSCETDREVDEAAAVARLALAEHDRIAVVVLTQSTAPAGGEGDR